MMKIPAAKVEIPEEDQHWILARIQEVLRSGRLTLGSYTREFEEEFARRHGVRYAAAVNSGTSALEIILRAVGLAGSDVIVPANTFFATAAAVVHAGARPIFCDVSPETFALSVKTVAQVLTAGTRAVIAVHIGGLVSPEIPLLREFCRRRGLVLVEDAAHAHGCSLDGQTAGSFGTAAAFSFYPTKVITAGEGGVIVTDDERIYRESLIYRDQGKASFEGNFHTRMGSNWRLSELHAIVGLSQIRRLDAVIRARARLAQLYTGHLEGLRGVVPLRVPPGAVCNFYKYIALLSPGIDRAHLKQALRDRYQVSLSGEVYDTPLHLQPVFKEFRRDELPGAEDVCRRHICLPLYPSMTEGEVDHVVGALGQVLAQLG